MLPNFICPGAMKSGTTTLYRLLKQHPDIYLPRKEICFFSADNWDKGFDWYQNIFRNHAGEKIVGEISPQYMYSPEAAERIYRLLGPDVKFIFLLRNPVKRAYSDYRMHQRIGVNAKSFKEAIAEGKNNLNKDFIGKGLYAQQIKYYLKYYPIENMKFVLFEEFIRERKQMIEEIFDFLGVRNDIDIDFELHENPDFIYKNERLRKAELRFACFIQKYIVRVLYRDKEKRKQKYSMLWHSLVVSNQRSEKEVPTLSPDYVRKLSDFYRDDIVELETVIGRNLEIWKYDADK